MKQVLRIRNKGLVQAEDIILLGSSSKGGQDGKIGMFGSGWKYALAWLMRNDSTPRVYAGLNQIKVESKMVQHRSNVVSVIIVDGKDTSITTDFGPKWTAWMALRELISNAIDEGDEIIEVLDASKPVRLENNYTNIFIDVNEEIKEVMDNYEHYFAFNRMPDFIHAKGMLYIKETSSPINVYRKGIRCYDESDKTLLDFNFNDIPITEDRLIDGGSGVFDLNAKSLIKACTDVPCIKAAILSKYTDMIPSEPTETFILAYMELIKEGHVFTTSTYKNTLGILTSGVVIHSKHFAELVLRGLISNPLEAIFKHLDFAFSRVDDKGRSPIIQSILNQFGEFKVFFGKMDTYHDVRVKENEFYIKDYLVDDIKDDYELAAKCLKEHSNALSYISELLKK